MKAVSVWQQFIVVCLGACLGGAVVPLPLQVVPEGIQAVNGSITSMGCVTSIVDFENVMYCGVFSTLDGGRLSFLVDDISPAIDTGDPDWASQLVTVAHNEPSAIVASRHVLLTFDFYPAVSLTAIQLDLFLCPQWGIGAESVTVFADNETNVILVSSSIEIASYTIQLAPSCTSLSEVLIPLNGGDATPIYHTWHLAVVLATTESWVHVGEVRFLDTPIPEINMPAAPPTIDSRASSSASPTPPTSDSSSGELTQPVSSPTKSSSPSPVPPTDSPNPDSIDDPPDFGVSSTACAEQSSCMKDSASIMIATGTNPPPSSRPPSQSLILLVAGFMGGILLASLVTVSLILMVVVIRRNMRKNSSAVSAILYDYPKMPAPTGMTENDAYGQLETSIPGRLGVFTSATGIQPNVAYGVFDRQTTADNDGYELTDTLPSQQYEEPQYSRLTIV